MGEGYDDHAQFSTFVGENVLVGTARGDRSELHELPGNEGVQSLGQDIGCNTEALLELGNHDVAFTAVSRGPLDSLLRYRDRMGWTFPWVSSEESDFNFDFNVSFTAESVATGKQSYNYQPLADWQLDPANLPSEAPGMSAFALVNGVVHHTYSAYARGLDALWNMWQWLDRAPLGRNERDMSWFARHDTYKANGH